MIRQNFNEGWSVSSGGGGMLEALRGAAPSGKPVRLPYDAMIHERPDPADVSGGQTGVYPGGQYIFTKTFFVPADWDLQVPEHRWVLVLLEDVAQYPLSASTMITYSHTLDYSGPMADLQSDDFNMCGAGLLFPQVCEDTNVLRCKTSLLETVTILHMMPLTMAEMNEINRRRKEGNVADGGPDWSDMFYPEDDAEYETLPFLCARKR